ncbi:MAG: ABC transporter ATP-binding protein [Candidatus Brocadiia bacterium]
MNATNGKVPLLVQAVVKRFRQGNAYINALNGVNLSASTGEFIAIMGASGSGKSTLLHSISGLTSIDSGHVLIDGVEISGLSDSELTRFRSRHIGLIFQAFNLIPVLTAEDNIRLPAVGSSGLDARVDALLDRLDLRSRRLHKPDALSGGEQQRVAIGRALVADPAILLADEPTGSLDSGSSQEFCKLMRDLCNEQHRTVVVVTHEPTVAMWADRVVVLQDGVDVGSFATDGLHDPQTISSGYQNVLRGISKEAAKCH